VEFTCLGEKGEETESFEECLSNYLSIGFVDARIALHVHEQREKHPNLYFNRNMNK